MSRYDAALAEMRAQRDELSTAIAVLERLNGATPAAVVQAILPTAIEQRRKSPKKSFESAAPRAVPSALDTTGMRIVEALRKTVRPVSVGELARHTKLSRYVLGNALKELNAAGQVVITGATTTKRVALAGAPAKEAP